MPEVVNTSALSFDTDISNESDNAQVEDNRPTAIKVENVSMIFNMASERLNNLKEYFLKLVKHQLFFEELVALDDISFEVKKGDVFGILGTNGSGKSTLLKIIAGVLEPSKGNVEINGAIAPLIELGAGFDMDLSARENIYLNGALLGYSKDFIEDHFDDIVEFAEIEKFLDMPMKNYSSGMVARIAFAIATVMVPEILIVDEVLSVGDFMFQQKCEDRITELIEKHGVTVLIVSHSNDQIERLCNKAIWIEKGHTRIMGDATKVAKLYRLLGGREGSQTSENTILNAANRISRLNTPFKENFIGISASNSIHINLKQIDLAWSEDKLDSIALVSNFTHTNAIMANGFCGSLDIPVVPVGYSEMDPFLFEWIKNKEPKKIYMFDRGDKIEYNVSELLLDIRADIEIIKIGSSLNMLDYSRELFSYGYSLGLWSDTAALIAFDNNLESLTAGPYLFHFKIPIFFMRTLDDNLDSTIKLLQECNINNIIIFGNNIPEYQKNTLISSGLNLINPTTFSQSQDSCLDITTYTYNSICNNHTMIIANKALAAWPDLLSTGCFGGRTNKPLILCDCRNLDSIAGCINFITNEDISVGYSILGESRILESEQELFSKLVASNSDEIV